MTLSLSGYNLSTIHWSKGFYVASGKKSIKGNDGAVLDVYKFQNGELIIRNKTKNVYYLGVSGTNKITPCRSGKVRYIYPTQLERVPSG